MSTASRWPWLRVKAGIRLSLETESLACSATETLTISLSRQPGDRDSEISWHHDHDDILRYLLYFQNISKRLKIYHSILQYLYYFQDFIFNFRYLNLSGQCLYQTEPGDWGHWATSHSCHSDPHDMSLYQMVQGDILRNIKIS